MKQTYFLAIEIRRISIFLLVWRWVDNWGVRNRKLSRTHLFFVVSLDSSSVEFLFVIPLQQKLIVNTNTQIKEVIHATFWSNNSCETEGRFAAFLFKLNRWKSDL